MPDEGPALGRPADAELTARILAETRRQLVRDGLGGLRIERVVRAVGCGKSAVYRRYADKAALAAAALTELIDVGRTPDTGNARADLLEHVTQNQATQSHAGARALWRVVFDPEVFPMLWDSFLVHRRDAGILILERAVRRGELPPNTALDIILDTIAGLTLYHQTVKGLPIASHEYGAVIDALLLHPPLLQPNPEPSSDAAEKENT